MNESGVQSPFTWIAPNVWLAIRVHSERTIIGRNKRSTTYNEIPHGLFKFIPNGAILSTLINWPQATRVRNDQKLTIREQPTRIDILFNSPTVSTISTLICLFFFAVPASITLALDVPIIGLIGPMFFGVLLRRIFCSPSIIFVLRQCGPVPPLVLSFSCLSEVSYIVFWTLVKCKRSSD